MYTRIGLAEKNENVKCSGKNYTERRNKRERAHRSSSCSIFTRMRSEAKLPSSTQRCPKRTTCSTFSSFASIVAIKFSIALIAISACSGELCTEHIKRKWAQLHRAHAFKAKSYKQPSNENKNKDSAARILFTLSMSQIRVLKADAFRLQALLPNNHTIHTWTPLGICFLYE